jgi:hypothetical protein
MSEFLEAWVAGGQTPPVKPADVKALFEFMQKAVADLKPGDTESTEQPTIGICAEVLAQACSPEANVTAVWLRSAIIGALLQTGLLSPWQSEGHLDDAVFEVAASFPFAGLERFNAEEFIQKLSDR